MSRCLLLVEGVRSWTGRGTRRALVAWEMRPSQAADAA
uniref:Uncharacterized protein n=1 Tax=Peronospora matthiolae TaxID=2874970 RepID=A0AAV1VCC3_9STRA